ncbi:CGNR zinc finger domain-containing protein [Paramicrobacterium chengjingii]|uniref:CGNR zinc finger domain-containing protein n=1 Tax=Paramicrobacterium chengjingii TaxID=2769067 RepID=A0ABX6YJ00_9MICO|nr:CGNR zinc finger domain-containing protein [Microbacterium chengjingii]QPZ38783.1 CGNR zinc finger domain-containing protein [Microbacterium chengjingii]
MVHDEDLLLAVLNSAPVVDGTQTDALQGAGGSELVERFGGTGSAEEMFCVRQVRDLLHEVIRDGADVTELTSIVSSAALTPQVTATGIAWELQAPPDERLAIRAALAWSDVIQKLPGRLRACANTECNLFLIDHSRPGSARWCSMATCGNRMKARSHARRQRTA